MTFVKWHSFSLNRLRILLHPNTIFDSSSISPRDDGSGCARGCGSSLQTWGAQLLRCPWKIDLSRAAPACWRSAVGQSSGLRPSKTPQLSRTVMNCWVEFGSRPVQLHSIVNVQYSVYFMNTLVALDYTASVFVHTFSFNDVQGSPCRKCHSWGVPTGHPHPHLWEYAHLIGCPDACRRRCKNDATWRNQRGFLVEIGKNIGATCVPTFYNLWLVFTSHQ